MRIIAGTFKGRPLKTPKGASTRPTQGMLREAVFNICQNEIEGARFLDLFAGSGAMGCEALSRGALQATFVEQNRNAISCIKENIAALEIESMTRVISLNALKAIELLIKENGLFDLIYIDPPYDLKLDLTPVTKLLSPNGILFFEERYKGTKPSPIDGLKIKDSRRFGEALLTIFLPE